MAKIIYNKYFPITGYKALGILFWIFVRTNTKPLDWGTINHEAIHIRQQIEMLIISCISILILSFIFDFSVRWLLLSPFIYFIWYGVEYLVRLCLYKNNSQAYKRVAFEQEASIHQNDSNYLADRRLFSWVKYLK